MAAPAPARCMMWQAQQQGRNADASEPAGRGSRRMRACLIATLLVPLMLAGGARAAEPFCPESAIKIVAPFPPGGPTDISARLLGDSLREQFGQTVIVESRAGASGAIGTAYVAQQPGNGCTILLSYDTEKAFRPVMLIGTIPNAVAVHPSQPWKTFDELMAAAKSGQIVYASGASAGVAHFSMKLIEQLYGVQMQHVPYKGAAPAVQDLLGGHVPIMIGSVFALAPGANDGRARALVQTGARRHPLMPDVPTVAEFGHPGFNTASWMGIFLPAGASDALVTRLHDALALALKNQTVRDRLTTLGVELAGSSPEELGAFVKAEIARWTEVVKRYDIKGD